MSTLNDEKSHDYYEDLLGVAAFGVLDAEEQADFDAHLATCDSCRTELAELVAVTDILPLSLDEVEPSAGLRDRIEAAILADVETTPSASPEPFVTPAKPRLVPPRNVSWLSSRTTKAIVSAAAILLIAVSVIAIALNMRGTETETIDVATLPQNVSGTLTYQPDDKKFTFDVEGMPQPPEGQVYQVWLIAGDSPKSVGIMHGDEFETRADRDKYDAFAITVEPGPDGSAGPTTAPIVVAPLHA